MRCEFSEAYNILFLGLYERLKNSHKIKVYAISHCNSALVESKNDDNDNGKYPNFSPQKLPNDFKIQPVDLREIDNGGSLFDSSSNSLSFEASLTDSNDDDSDSEKKAKKAKHKKKRGNSIDTI